MVEVIAAVTPEVEAPRDLPHSRRDHLGRAPDPGRQSGGREGLAVGLCEVEVGVVGQEEVPGRSRVGHLSPSLFQDEPSRPLPRQLYLWWKDHCESSLHQNNQNVQAEFIRHSLNDFYPNGCSADSPLCLSASMKYQSVYFQVLLPHCNFNLPVPGRQWKSQHAVRHCK